VNFLPTALGVAAIAIVLLLPHLRRLRGFYPPSIPIGDLYERITFDALAGSALGSVLSTLQSYSILSQLRGLSMPSPQFSGLVVAFLLGWLIAGPAGGVITYRFHQRSSETTRPMLVAAAGAVCAYSVPQMYAGLVILGILWA